MPRRQQMQPHQYIGIFVLLVALLLVIQLAVIGDNFSETVVATSLCVAAGGILGVAYRRRARRDAPPEER
jgi:hypothetical protein